MKLAPISLDLYTDKEKAFLAKGNKTAKAGLSFWAARTKSKKLVLLLRPLKRDPEFRMASAAGRKFRASLMKLGDKVVKHGVGKVTWDSSISRMVFEAPDGDDLMDGIDPKNVRLFAKEHKLKHFLKVKIGADGVVDTDDEEAFEQENEQELSSMEDLALDPEWGDYDEILASELLAIHHQAHWLMETSELTPDPVEGDDCFPPDGDSLLGLLDANLDRAELEIGKLAKALGAFATETDNANAKKVVQDLKGEYLDFVASPLSQMVSSILETRYDKEALIPVLKESASSCMSILEALMTRVDIASCADNAFHRVDLGSLIGTPTALLYETLTGLADELESTL